LFASGTATGFSAGRPWRNCVSISALCCGAAVLNWDISRPEQRTAWANGEKGTFYPYGKTRAQVLAEQD
jgi:hypothetical protein